MDPIGLWRGPHSGLVVTLQQLHRDFPLWLCSRMRIILLGYIATQDMQGLAM